MASDKVGLDVGPTDWRVVTVGEIAHLSSGGFIARDNYDREKRAPYPVCGANGPIGWSAAFNFSPPILAVGRVGAAGAINVYDSPAWVTDNVLVVQPENPDHLPWLENFFRTVDWRSMQTGSTQPLITQTAVKNLRLPLPPINEQQRLVNKIEELRARVNAAREHLARVPLILKRFRQSVLAAACSGRLTGDWRNIRGGFDTVPSLLGRVASTRAKALQGARRTGSPRANSTVPLNAERDMPELRDLPSAWAWATVDELATKVVDGVHRTPHYVDEGVPFITVRNLTAGPGIFFDNVSYVTEADHCSFVRRANPECGDLLVSKDGTLGVVRAVRTQRKFSIFVSVALVKPVLSEMTDYLELALSSPQGQEEMIATGSGLQHVHLRDLKRVRLPIPPFPEQHEIVRRVDELLALANTIEQRVVAATARADRLSQAILAKAFRGELVPTDAELQRAGTDRC